MGSPCIPRSQLDLKSVGSGFCTSVRPAMKSTQEREEMAPLSNAVRAPFVFE
jgi:hypothetical protein